MQHRSSANRLQSDINNHPKDARSHELQESDDGEFTKSNAGLLAKEDLAKVNQLIIEQEASAGSMQN